MDYYKLLNLNTGHNNLIVDYSVLPKGGTGKIPVCKIPENSVVLNTYFNVLEPFIIQYSGDVGTSYSSPMFSLGTSEDTEFFINQAFLNEFDKLKSTVKESNYYKSQNLHFENDKNVYLYIHSIPRVWSSGPNMSMSKMGCSTFGHVSHSVCVGGVNFTEGILSSTEIFDGVSWSTGPNLSSGKRYFPTSVGVFNRGYVFFGSNDWPHIDDFISTSIEYFNGVSFSTISQSGNEVTWPVSWGNSSSRMYIGGGERISSGGSVVTTNSVKRFEHHDQVISEISSSLILSRTEHGGSGGSNQAVVTGGRSVNNRLTSLTENIRNESVSTGSPLPRTIQYGSSFGINYDSVFSNFGETYEYDDFTWYTSSKSSLVKSSFGATGKKEYGLITGGTVSSLTEPLLSIHDDNFGAEFYHVDDTFSTEIYSDVPPEQQIITGRTILGITLK